MTPALSFFECGATVPEEATLRRNRGVTVISSMAFSGRQVSPNCFLTPETNDVCIYQLSMGRPFEKGPPLPNDYCLKTLGKSCKHAVDSSKSRTYPCVCKFSCSSCKRGTGFTRRTLFSDLLRLLCRFWLRFLSVNKMLLLLLLMSLLQPNVTNAIYAPKGRSPMIRSNGKYCAVCFTSIKGYKERFNPT